MSMSSSLPEWKQLLLERKRREEEERGRREKWEEEKLANMPAWKRGIIQRRKAKQEGIPGPEVCHIEVRSPSDGLSDTDSSVTVNLGSDLSLSPDPGMWLDSDTTKPSAACQVSIETIVPFNENPFIRTQRKTGRELCSPKSYNLEAEIGADVEMKTDRFRDLSEGRDKERSKQRKASWDKSIPKDTKDWAQWRNQEKEFPKVRRDDADRDKDPASPVYSSMVPCLRTIRADNIIIIEQERRSTEEKRQGGRWREAECERGEEENQPKRGLKMDLKEILAGGGSVTELRASEVLIIKPPASPSDRGKVGKEDADGKREGRELRADMSWLREKVRESVKEKERPWGQATVIKEDKKDNSEDSVFVERGGRVSQLLSKFGQHHKPSRSKSSDNLKPLTKMSLGDEEDGEEEDLSEERSNTQLKGVPKRSFSFSDRVFSAKENGFDEERRTRDRLQSEKAHWMEVGSLGRETAGKIKMGCARLLEKDRFVKHRHWQNKGKNAQYRNDSVDSDEGFTVACVKNIEGISFAKRVPIRQEVKAMSMERDAKKLTTMDLCVEKDAKFNLQASSSLSNVNDSSYRNESAFRECSSLLCTIPDISTGPELAWSSEVGAGTVLADLKEEFNLDQIGKTKVYCTDEVERPHKTAFEVSKNLEEPSDAASVSLDAKKISNFEIKPAPLAIQIPRTVFYVAEEMLDKNKLSDIQDWGSGKEVERLDDWRTGKPLSRIESLKEKRQQQQIENMKDKSDIEVEEICDKSAKMAKVETEQDAKSKNEKSVVAVQTSMTEFDVTQEVAKHSPQLPVSNPEADQGEEVEAKGCEQEGVSTGRELSDIEETEKHDELQPGESLEEEKSDEEIEDLSLESEESLSPSPPQDPSLIEAMSRIYNLETVGSRSGLCLRDRAVEIPPVHLIKIKSLNSQQQQQGEGCGVQTIQRHFENFKLKERERVKSQSSPSPKSILKDIEDKRQHSPKGTPVKEEEIRPKLSPKRVNSPDQTITNKSSILRCQSPENVLKISDLAPTPASSPCSPSPAQSPNISPSPSPTPALFTIKSASGGQVKRGTTITIAPKRSPVQGSPTPGSNAASVKNTSPNTPAPVSPSEQAKKKYPTVEEIEVIGGYLKLEKSCLVKNSGMPKKATVCFAEDHLEQLCEYPSETSMFAGSPYPPEHVDHQDRVWTELNQDRGPDQNQEEEDEVETVRMVKSTRSVGTATGRGQRAGQCHPLLKKHSV